MTTQGAAGSVARRRNSPHAGYGWTTLVAGAYLGLAPIWTDGAPTFWFIVLGVLIAAAALWALGAGTAPVPQWVLVILGAVLFVAPWIAGFAAMSLAAWTAWIGGALVAALAAFAMGSSATTG